MYSLHKFVLHAIQTFICGNGDLADYKFVAGVVLSLVQVLQQLKTRRVEGMMHVKSVMVYSPHFGVMWDRSAGEQGASSGVVLIT
ncbi:hypothetical protein TNCV_3435011 [Trichonephila clavipes]|nr:hypothetical protein TNCV_3435011 [Trichonephila clavipes]